MNFTFDLTEKDKIKDCMDKYGVVAIKNILSKQEIQDTIKDIENIMKQYFGNLFSFSDPETYNLPEKDFNNHGVVGKVPLFTKQLIKNRFNDNVIEAFETVYGDNIELLCQHDRVAWMRPTIGPNSEDWTKFRTPFNKPGVHLDMDPVGYYEKNFNKEVLKAVNELKYNDLRDFINENNFKHINLGNRYHGVLNLLDNEELDGGFHCYLGGHNLLSLWFEKAKPYLDKPNPNGRYVFNNLDIDNMFSNTTRITAEPGTLIIFDSRLPHGTKPNYTSNSRLIQFISYQPKSLFEKKTLERRKKSLNKIFDEIGYKLNEKQSNYI